MSRSLQEEKANLDCITETRLEENDLFFLSQLTPPGYTVLYKTLCKLLNPPELFIRLKSVFHLPLKNKPNPPPPVTLGGLPDLLKQPFHNLGAQQRMHAYKPIVDLTYFQSRMNGW